MLLIFCLSVVEINVQVCQIHIIPDVFFPQWLQEEEAVGWAVATSSRSEDNFGLGRIVFCIRGVNLTMCALVLVLFNKCF